MKSFRLQGLILVAIATLVLAPLAHAEPNWLPGSRADAPWDELDDVLKDATSVLYLNGSCEVVAMLTPDPAYLDDYVPKVKKIREYWYDRVPTNTMNCGTSSKFLETKWLSGAVQQACNPNQMVGDAGLAGVECGIYKPAIKNLIVLNANHDALLVLKGSTAGKFAAASFSATILGRTRYAPACTPAIPSPCMAPKSGVLKLVNNVYVCVCQ